MASPQRGPVPPHRPPAGRGARRRAWQKFEPLPEADTILLPDMPAGDGRQPRRPPEPGWPPRRQAAAPARRQPRRPAARTRRRAWISRAALLAILGMQAIISLRLRNTASADEALFLYTGHLEWGHLLYRTPLPGGYASYLPGAPLAGPMLGALADTAGGLAAARGVSLGAVLAATALLYALTRRLFNERVGLCAAAVFSVAAPTLTLGHLATGDAPALCLLAFGAWIVVRTAAFRWPAWLLAAPAAAAAVAAAYAALLFVPTVVMLAALASWPYRGARALRRPLWLAGVVAGLLLAALRKAGLAYGQGAEATAVSLLRGATPAGTLLRDCAEWGGPPFALAVIGAICYAWRPRNEAGEDMAPAGGRRRRALLGIALAGTALLAPAVQVPAHSGTSLSGHIGFGLFFAAPMAGAGLARIIGGHFHRVQLGIGLWGAAMVAGMTAAASWFHAWPSSQPFVAEMADHLRPDARYLVELDQIPIYYLRTYPDAQPSQFTSTYYIRYRGGHGRPLTGTAGYLAAIRAGYFRVVAYDGQATPALDLALARALRADTRYRLAAAIPSGGVTCYLWVRR